MFAGRSTLATYLTVIARRVTVHRLMKSRAVPTGDGVVDQPDRQPTPDETTARKDEIEQLLAGLSAEDRAILTMHDHDGLSYGEISRATGIPVGSIGPRLSRARATIRAATEKPADEGPADDTATG
jgi:RNA polymerase sigma-70 factor (ECF subfamily)